VPALLLGRLTQGLGWAMFGTANNVVLARLAPASRRGEASAWFNIMWALGFIVGPPLGLAIYAVVGQELPFVVASIFALTALGTVTILRRMVPAATLPASSTMPETPGLVARLVEPAALPTMAILSTFMAGQALFLAFAPVYARSIGAPDQVLALYFPVFGIVLALGQLLTGRFSDRFGRRATIIAGCATGSTGLLVAAIAPTWAVFAAGAAAFALASAVVNPAAAAATIDRAPAGRTGVAMATFSIGYQVAFGLGGALWGIVIAAVGYPEPFLVAIGLQIACAAVAFRYLAPGAAQPAAALSRP
jgi:MFS family permease